MTDATDHAEPNEVVWQTSWRTGGPARAEDGSRLLEEAPVQLECPQCGRSIPSEDINVQAAIAKCSACGAVFGFADKVPGARAESRKPVVDLPRRFSVAQDGADLVITRRWFSPSFVFLLFFCVFWDGFLAFWYFMAFTDGSPLPMKLFPVVHVAVGVGLSYFTVAGFVNRTLVRVGPGEIQVRHVPLPWPGNKVLSAESVEQLFSEEKISRGRNGVNRSYQVSAVLRNGAKTRLVRGLQSPDQALFIEQQVERHLGIEDRPIPGEMANLPG